MEEEIELTFIHVFFYPPSKCWLILFTNFHCTSLKKKQHTHTHTAIITPSVITDQQPVLKTGE